MSRLDDIQQRLDAATPGPWEWSPDEGGTDLHGFSCGATVQRHYGWLDTDAELIAHAPADLAALLTVARAAQRVVEAEHLRHAVVDGCGKCHGLAYALAALDAEVPA